MQIPARILPRKEDAVDDSRFGVQHLWIGPRS
jgi:hypothetical protein